MNSPSRFIHARHNYVSILYSSVQCLLFLGPRCNIFNHLRFDDQIEIEGAGSKSFSDGGDSGSLIFDRQLGAVALLFAGGDEGGSNDMGLTYGNPIRAVLDALKVDLLV